MKPSGAAVLLLIAALPAILGCGRNGAGNEIVVLQVPKDEPQGPQAPVLQPETAQAITASDTPPSSWKKLPSSPLRLLSYGITDDASGRGVDISLIMLGGGAGGILENVNRWRGQIGLAPFDAEGLRKASSTRKTSLGTITLVDMTGRPEKGDASKDGRIIAAILPIGERTFFFKLRGNPDMAGHHKQEFLDWISTIRVAP